MSRSGNLFPFARALMDIMPADKLAAAQREAAKYMGGHLSSKALRRRLARLAGIGGAASRRVVEAEMRRQHELAQQRRAEKARVEEIAAREQFLEMRQERYGW